MDDLTSITADDLAASHENFSAERVNIVAKNAVTANYIRAAARRPEGVAANALGFDIEVTQVKGATRSAPAAAGCSQALTPCATASSRSTTSRPSSSRRPIPSSGTSSKKSNWFLENILDTLDEPLNGRLVSFLLTDPIGDGGQWDMFRSLVKKYGVVPKDAMPETACSRNTGDMDRYLTRYLRGGAKRLRQSHEAAVLRWTIYAP